MQSSPGSGNVACLRSAVATFRAWFWWVCLGECASANRKPQGVLPLRVALSHIGPGLLVVKSDSECHSGSGPGRLWMAQAARNSGLPPVPFREAGAGPRRLAMGAVMWTLISRRPPSRLQLGNLAFGLSRWQAGGPVTAVFSLSGGCQALPGSRGRRRPTWGPGECTVRLLPAPTTFYSSVC